MDTSQKATDKRQNQWRKVSDIPNCINTEQLTQFLSHIPKDYSLKELILQAMRADAAALVAKELGYEV